jgi:hypothetical protein
MSVIEGGGGGAGGAGGAGGRFPVPHALEPGLAPLHHTLLLSSHIVEQAVLSCTVPLIVRLLGEFVGNVIVRRPDVAKSGSSSPNAPPFSQPVWGDVLETEKCVAFWLLKV